MGLLENILARASMNVDPALYTAPDPDMETYAEAAARGARNLNMGPVERRIKSPFPDVNLPPPPAALPQLASQAGILTPNIGQLGSLSAQPAAPPAPNPADPESMPLPIPLPEARPPGAPGSTDLSSANRTPPVDLITPPQKAALAKIAPTVVGSDAPTTIMPSASLFGGSSILDRLTGALGNRSNTLLALAAGFAGAPSIGQGISRAAAAAIPARAADIKEQLTTQGQRMTTAALLKAGVPMQLAVAAQSNPALMKMVADNYLTDRKSEIKEIKTKDAFGNEHTQLVAVNPYDLSYKNIGADGAGGAGSGTGPAAPGTSAGGPTIFAPGVTAYDPTKVGPDYLAQFSPEIQAGVKAYLRGDSLPTGRQQLMQTIKTIAQKYGDDIGMPANDQLYSQRKVFANSLGDVKSGVGLQVKGFQQGLQHMKQLSDKLVRAGNWNGMGIEPIANAENWFRNLTTGQQDIVRGIQTDAHLLAGETGKLFSGSQGGGVREREAMASRFGDPKMSGPAAAGALESALEAMEGGLMPLISRRDELFPGGEKPRGGQFRGPNEQAAVDAIRRNIAILRGQQAAPGQPAAATAPTAPTVVPPGAYVWTPDRGLIPK